MAYLAALEIAGCMIFVAIAPLWNVAGGKYFHAIISPFWPIWLGMLLAGSAIIGAIWLVEMVADRLEALISGGSDV